MQWGSGLYLGHAQGKAGNFLDESPFWSKLLFCFLCNSSFTLLKKYWFNGSLLWHENFSTFLQIGYQYISPSTKPSYFTLQSKVPVVIFPFSSWVLIWGFNLCCLLLCFWEIISEQALHIFQGSYWITSISYYLQPTLSRTASNLCHRLKFQLMVVQKLTNCTCEFKEFITKPKYITIKPIFR